LGDNDLHPRGADHYFFLCEGTVSSQAHNPLTDRPSVAIAGRLPLKTILVATAAGF